MKNIFLREIIYIHLLENICIFIARGIKMLLIGS